jgi:hypothetical protein
VAEKWADYLVTAVRFNAAGTHIEVLEVRADNGESTGLPSERSRATVVALIEGGDTFCTATKNNAGNWQKGAVVKVVVVDSQKFLKTKADGIKQDNLDYLPTF